jgi:quercetin dioxygenase-like cupin family protein
MLGERWKHASRAGASDDLYNRRCHIQGERQMTQPAKLLLPAIALLTLAFALPASAQQGINRTPLATYDFPPGFVTVLGRSEIAANTCFERHTHPGLENFYVLEGEYDLTVGDRPAQRMKAGDSGQIPAGVAHSACTHTRMFVLTVLVLKKGKPLFTPAPLKSARGNAN